MKHISLKTSEVIKNILPDTLEKDLCDNEEICPICGGLGVVLGNNPYGIKGDTSEKAESIMLPYNNQALVFCPNCYNGVIKLCKYCGQPLYGGFTMCNCEGYKEHERCKQATYWQKVIECAEEVKESDVTTMLYDKEDDKYYYSVDECLKHYADNGKTPPERLWVCSQADLSMDADDIVSSACEDLHEDAMDAISESDIQELQYILDDWCKKQVGGTTTYYPRYKQYVRVPREEETDKC